MNTNWLWQSLVVMLFLIPAWLAVTFFNRNYQVRPEIFLIWYLLGIATSSILFQTSSLGTILPSGKVLVAILLIGCTLGAITNNLLFRAVVNAPNPGLPIAIANGASIGVFLVSAILSRTTPNYFSPVKIDLFSFLGVVLTVIGISLIAVRR